MTTTQVLPLLLDWKSTARLSEDGRSIGLPNLRPFNMMMPYLLCSSHIRPNVLFAAFFFFSSPPSSSPPPPPQRLLVPPRRKRLLQPVEEVARHLRRRGGVRLLVDV